MKYIKKCLAACLAGAALVATGLFAVGCASADAASAIQEVDMAYVQDHLGAATIVDARSFEEFAGANADGLARGGHIPGAITIPDTLTKRLNGQTREIEDLARLFKNKGADPQAEVIVYSNGDGRAQVVADLFSQAGYSQVSIYGAGIQDWAADESNSVEEAALSCCGG